MFTRCPACRTVFHITAAELRAADGTVICGACDTTFDALDSLSETRPVDSEPAGVVPGRAGPAVGSPHREERRQEGAGFAGPGPIPSVPPPAEPPLEAVELVEARDEEDFLEELESLIGGDDGLDDPFTGTDTGTGTGKGTSAGTVIDIGIGIDSAAGTGADAGDDDEEIEVAFGATRPGLDEQELAAAELDPAGLGEIEPDDLELDEALPDVAAGRPEWESTTGLEEEEFRSGEVDFEIVEASLEEEADDRLLEEDFEEDLPDPDSVFRVDELDDDQERPLAASRDDAVGVGVIKTSTRSPLAAPEDPEHDDAEDPPATALATSAAAGPARRAGGRAAPATEAEPEPEFVREPRRGRGWRRMLLALVALALLGATWAHSQHGKLLRHPLGEAVLLPIYGLLGMEVTPAWDPSAYRALHWEAVAEPDRPGYLTVGVDFQNNADFAQPYPVIRIVLEDRFGQRLGTHDATPGEYLRAHASGARLPAGGRVRTTVVAPDPGARADGFRVDFCLEVHGRGLVCGPEPFR